MDILFINSPQYKESGNIWKHASGCLPPFGLALLAAIVRKKGYSVSILDCNAREIGLDKIEENLPPSSPRFIGLTASSVIIENSLEIAKIVKKRYSDTKVVIGGVHVSVLPKEVLSSEYVDYVVMGEGEYSFLDLLSNKNPAEIKGIGFKKDGKIFINSPQEMITDLNIFPLAAYDLLPMDKYYKASGTYKRLPSFGIITSRGCPGRCTFCTGNFLGNRIRFKSAEKIVEEIIYLQKNYGIKDITFYDDTFTTLKSRVKDFCQLILEKNLDLTWSCFSRVDTIDLELLLAMKKSGCYQVMYGVESAVPEILKNINKGITPQKVEETVANTKKAGLEVRLAFMIGNPGDTEETIKKTIKYAIDLDPDLVTFNITTPYPGTEMLDWAKKNNYLIHEDWTKYDLAEPVMKLPTIDSGRLLYYYKKAYRQFYFRPAYILKRLMNIRSVDDLKRNFQPFIGLLKFSFGK